ncbi:MAG: DUF1850 domain-containing protein [Thermodesulfobacteriota bacterium]|nr:DUF1850 domain-containing protein [Thermodesulfobacteriota bacterium]
MNKKRIIILSSIAALFFFSLIPCHVLRIETARKNQTVFIQIIWQDYRFSTRYIHSVELSPVREYFKIDNNFKIVLYETTFSSCNTGLPTTLSGDEKFYNVGTHLRISNMHRVLPELDLWVNKKYDNTLTLGDGEVLELPSLAGDTLLRVAVEKLPFLKFLYLKAKI